TIKFILVNKRIIKCKNKIAICETTISELNEELEETMKESQRIYKEETAKEQPDMLCIEELAKLGYQPAQRWLNKTNCQHGKQIFEEEIKKETPDLNNIIKAADLGCPEACMYYAEPLLLGFKSDYSSDPFVDDNDRLTTSSPKLRLCLKLQPYFKTAAKAKIPNAKFYYLYTTERAGCTQYMDYCFSDMDLTTLKKEFEALMKATNLDNKYKGICQQCLKRIEKAKGERYVKKNRAELAKWSGFYSDLPSYQRMVNSTNKSTSKTVEAVEYYPVIDVSGM
ncbi:MAG: hypothetical protein J5766_02340, partial [Clostridia bacterium]|nr:hypothetical protein [Clostridia bacterium]